ncbi:MAG: ATP-binding cassette domain-containing protein [Burkholderiaceae bacterium]
MNAPTAPPLLEARDLARYFPVRHGTGWGRAATVRAVDGVDLVVEAGRTLGVVGESGCGKSTLGRLLLGLVEPTRGEVRFEGRALAGLRTGEMRATRRALQIVFQDPYSSLDPQMTVEATLAEPITLHRLARTRAELLARVGSLLEQVGLDPAHRDRYPHEFSGGQRQRVCIARALAVQPRLIVCDEAVSALDVSVQAQIVNLLRDLQLAHGLSYVFIAHDLAVVRQIAHRVAVMYLGRIVELADADTLFAAPAHPYTQALIDAVPAASPRRRATDTQPLAGDAPSPLDPPPGCHFHTRCPHARDLCRHRVPALEPAAPGQRVACHFWRELGRPGSTARASSAPDARLVALQSAFTTRSSRPGDTRPAHPPPS